MLDRFTISSRAGTGHSPTPRTEPRSIVHPDSATQYPTVSSHDWAKFGFGRKSQLRRSQRSCRGRMRPWCGSVHCPLDFITRPKLPSPTLIPFLGTIASFANPSPSDRCLQSSVFVPGSPSRSITPHLLADLHLDPLWNCLQSRGFLGRKRGVWIDGFSLPFVCYFFLSFFLVDLFLRSSRSSRLIDPLSSILTR